MNYNRQKLVTTNRKLIKKITSILFFLLISNSILAKRPQFNAQFKLDSLRSIIAKNQSEDSIKVFQLSDLGRLCFHEGLYLEGLLASQKVLSVSKKIGFKKGEGIYLKTLNELNENGLKPYFYQSKWFFTDNNITYTPSKLQLRRYKNLNPDSVIIELKKAAIYFENNRDEQLLGNIYLQISNIYLTKEKWQECINYAEKALVIFKNKVKEPVSIYSALIYKLYSLEKMQMNREAKATEIEANILVSNSTDKREMAVLSEFMAEKYKSQNRTALAIEYFLKSEKVLKELNEKESRINILTELADIYGGLGMHKKAAENYLKLIQICEETNNLIDIENAYFQLGFRLIDLKNFVLGRKYIQKGYDRMIKGNPRMQNQAKAKLFDADGQILMAKGKYKEAIPFFELSAINFQKNKERDFSYFTNFYLAICYQKLGLHQKSIEYGMKSFEAIGKYGSFLQSLSLLLSDNYKKAGNTTLAYKFLKIHTDVIAEKEKLDLRNSLADLEIREVVKKAEFEKESLQKDKENESFKQKMWIGGISLALLGAIVFMYFLSKSIKNKQKANSKLEEALSQLKSTQAQLIQSEKLASLGELTAGIAHEIQNPLNFVNNFSEVSNELIQEIKDERQKPKENQDESLVDEIFNDISQNLEKIALHGKRASSIVKGMLDHSKTSSNQKELTDINALADEYLRLTFHGLRAKDKSFNADFKTDFDTNLPKINVIPQDIGRVLLNLINNAFYACTERSRGAVSQRNTVETLHATSLPKYQPTVIVSSQQFDNQIIIKISENGIGMNDTTKAKIFQPFFTTKPTGQGTGLGLSLAYDIITKGHGGNIDCESVEGEGTTFTVSLPIL